MICNNTPYLYQLIKMTKQLYHSDYWQVIFCDDFKRFFESLIFFCITLASRLGLWCSSILLAAGRMLSMERARCKCSKCLESKQFESKSVACFSIPKISNFYLMLFRPITLQRTQCSIYFVSIVI